METKEKQFPENPQVGDVYTFEDGSKYEYVYKQLLQKNGWQPVKKAEEKKQVDLSTLVIDAVKHYYGEKGSCTPAQVQYIKDLSNIEINNPGGSSRLFKFLTKRQASEAIEAAKLGRKVIINVA